MEQPLHTDTDTDTDTVIAERFAARLSACVAGRHDLWVVPTVPYGWWAIECNPNGQWGWLPDAQAITEAFADILTRKEAADHEDAGRP
ncbi:MULTISPECIES: hypothetical protein [unclassified Streptomyces]|uniref:hypothetical protein n=1 Tax=unclassified Streptomyces TaxID=2593676 RepID=UPI00148A002C|nr:MULTISPECIES: hypothetical protein [unclassified Streptomyces]